MDMFSQEPWASFVDNLNRLASRLYEQTGTHGLTRISLKPDFGIRLGVVPGTSVDVYVAAGRVEVYCETEPRLAGVFTIDEG